MCWVSSPIAPPLSLPRSQGSHGCCSVLELLFHPHFALWFLLYIFQPFPSIPQHYLTHGSCPKASLRCQQDHSAFHGLMEHMEPVHIQVTPLCLNITQRNHSEAMSRASVCIQPFAHHVNGGQGTKTSSINTMTGISLFLGWA